MKGTLLSFLQVFRFAQKVEIPPQLFKGDSPTELSPQEVQNPNAVSSEPSVVDTTTQPKGIVAYLLRRVAIIRKSVNRLPFVRAGNQLSDSSENGKNTPEANGNTQTSKIPKASVFTTMDNDVFIDEGTLIKAILDQAHVQLALSNSIEDVAQVFKALEVQIGKQEFIIAIIISYICERKLWKRYGYPSMNKFLDDLPGVCKVSRQTFYNAAQAGEVIRLLSAPDIEGLGVKLSFPLTPELLYRNYSKLKFLYRIYFVWRLGLCYHKLGEPPNEQLMINFRDMTYREFEAYMVNYEADYQEDIIRCSRRYPKESSRKKGQPTRSKPQKAEPPVLTKEETEICREIRFGHGIGFLFNSNPLCAKSVVQYLQNARQKEYEQKWRGYPATSELYIDNRNCRTFCTTSELSMPNDEGPPMSERDWSELFPGELCMTTYYIEDLLERYLTPNELKKVLAKSFKSKTELTLAQAYLIYRMEHNGNLLNISLLEYLRKNEIQYLHGDAVMTFAVNVLGIELSRFKWLKRIGAGLNTLAWISRDIDKARITSDGFLEKLTYLPAAKKHHPDKRLVLYALNNVSAKRFRQFARSRSDDLSKDPITMKDYAKAKPFIDKLRSYQAEGKPITIIGLESNSEQLFDYINMAMEVRGEHLRNRFPGIIWEPSLNAEPVAEPVVESVAAPVDEISSENGENELGTQISAEETPKDDLRKNSDDDLLKPAA